MEPENMFMGNLAFFLNYSDGTSPQEIESELYKLAFQVKGTVHYDRVLGGEFEDLEQENSNDASFLIMNFASSMIESVYLLNQEKGFSPYIVMGFNDITLETNEETAPYIVMKYRLLDDLEIAGQIELEVGS